MFHGIPSPRGLVVSAALLTLTVAAVLPWTEGPQAQGRVPTATLRNATTVLRLPGTVDSNSPSVWDIVRGQPRLSVMTSSAGQPRVASGSELDRIGTPLPARFTPHPGHGVWMEAVVQDAGGAWYGFYHNERPVDGCGRNGQVRPQIGAARSRTRGLTWRDFGPVIETPLGTDVCDSPNRYFIGGAGDLSVILDRDHLYLYLFFSQYGRARSAQGVGVARMPWAARDEPQGHLDVWTRGAWVPLAVQSAPNGTAANEPAWQFQPATPLVAPDHPWHDRDQEDDGFWGPAVHWNTALRQYVKLLNRTADNNFRQEGIYVSFADRLDDPARWSPPRRILKGGAWYPQVVGTDIRTGTDKEAGATARFFMGGESRYLIDFSYR